MKIKERELAFQLRRQGKSLKEISQTLGVSKSSVSLWVRDLKLSNRAKERIRSKLSAGQKVAVQRKKELSSERDIRLKVYAEETVNASNFSKASKLVMLSLVYWCEGGKNPSYGIYFTNSDPKLMSAFLSMLRSSFNLDESKFRPCLHIHGYHHRDKQLAFWSKVTNIPIQQFTKPYLKPHTTKRIKEGYQGCLGLKYYDAKVARELMEIAKVYLGV